MEDEDSDEPGGALDSEAMSHKMAMEDKSPHAYLLGTQYLIIERNVNNPFAQREIAEVPKKVLATLFEFLSFQYQPAIRQLAGECLGLICEFQVDTVTDFFVSVLRKSMAAGHPREFATFFLGISFLRLGFTSQKKLDAMKILFSTVLSVSEKISRGVLRGSLCKALTNILEQGVLSHDTPPPCEEYYSDAFYVNFYATLNTFYNVVKKWVKSKTKVNGLRLMMTMLLLDKKFRSQKSDDFLTIFLAEAKDPKLYKYITEIASIYIQRLAILNEEGEEDEEEKEKGNQASSNSARSHLVLAYKSISPRIFLQKSDLKKVSSASFPSQSVSNNISDMLLSVARSGVVLLQEDKTVLSVISSGTEYHPEYKAIIFKTFAKIHNEIPDYVKYNNNNYS